MNSMDLLTVLSFSFHQIKKHFVSKIINCFGILTYFHFFMIFYCEFERVTLMLINAISFNRPNPPPTPGVGCSGHVTRGVKSENQIYRTNGFLSGNNSDAPQKFDV